MKKNLNVSLRLPPESREFIDEMAKQDKRNMTTIINHMVEYFMQEGTPTKALKKLYKR